MYCFIRWKQTEEGYGPDIPEETGFLLLAEPGRACDGTEFALFQCDLADDCEMPESVHPVCDELATLLESAKDYPPALALVRDDLDGDDSPSEVEFSGKLIERLTFHLRKQIHSPFFMAKALKTRPGYREAGGYYWIVGRKGKSVLWVSRDYFVYQDPLGDFELDPNEIERRFHQMR